MAGQVTGLKVQRRNPGRVNVYLDGEFAFGLQRITAAWLSVGQELSDEQVAELRTKDESEQVYQAALRLIGYRSRTAEEVRQRLERKGYDPDQVSRVVERLIENRLIDDRQYASDWVADRVAFHPRGRRLLAQEMQKKGLDRGEVERALSALGDETPLAEQAGRKVVGRWAGLEEREFIRRCAAYLGRRGFTPGVCFEVARRLRRELHQDMD